MQDESTKMKGGEQLGVGPSTMTFGETSYHYTSTMMSVAPPAASPAENPAPDDHVTNMEGKSANETFAEPVATASVRFKRRMTSEEYEPPHKIRKLDYIRPKAKGQFWSVRQSTWNTQGNSFRTRVHHVGQIMEGGQGTLADEYCVQCLQESHACWVYKQDVEKRVEMCARCLRGMVKCVPIKNAKGLEEQVRLLHLQLDLTKVKLEAERKARREEQQDAREYSTQLDKVTLQFSRLQAVQSDQ